MRQCDSMKRLLCKLSVVQVLLLLVACVSSTSALQITNDDNTLAYRLARSLKDRLNLNEDGITHVDPFEQDTILEMVGRNCTERIMNSTRNPARCPIEWDTIICWPETQVNKTVYIDCPKYVDNFKIFNKASKTCILDPTTNEPTWTKTDLKPCLMIPVIEEDEEMESLEKHMTNIIYIRICGYVASMVSLSLSIIILLRPKLRCPRNYVHVNLFLAFVTRTILVMLVDVILHNKVSAVFQTKNEKSNAADLMQAQYIPCQVMISLFRYTGSVYHVAIFSEALYLVLLLRFPYYNEKKGSKFCIIAAWVVPFLWIIPWVVVKRFVDNRWCWQMESNWNLLIKIPHSLLLVVNIASAVFIIKVLYSKMRNRLTKEKIMKYRRLAKSILILIPIFGLHFIVFAWLPYASIINLSQTFEIISSYVETFFNAFQGVVVSIACCFMHREVRIECLLFACELLQKIRCLRTMSCMKCLDSDYIRQLRYVYHESRAGSLATRLPGGMTRPGTNDGPLTLRMSSEIIEQPQKQKSRSKLAKVLTCSKDKRESVDQVEANLLSLLPPPQTDPGKTRTYSNNDSIDASLNFNGGCSSSSNKRKSSVTMSLVSSGPNKMQQFFSCLFGNKRNDFHQYNSASRSRMPRSAEDNRTTTRGRDGSLKPCIDEEEPGHEATATTTTRNPLIKLFKFDETNRSESISSNGKKKVRLLLDVDGQNIESIRLNSHRETGSDEDVRRNLIATASAPDSQKKVLRATKSLTNSEMSSIDCQLNNTATESTNCTATNLTTSSNNLTGSPAATCVRCQKRRVSSISNNFFSSDGPTSRSSSTEEDSPSKYCKCRLDQLMIEQADDKQEQLADPPATHI